MGIQRYDGIFQHRILLKYVEIYHHISSVHISIWWAFYTFLKSPATLPGIGGSRHPAKDAQPVKKSSLQPACGQRGKSRLDRKRKGVEPKLTQCSWQILLCQYVPIKWHWSNMKWWVHSGPSLWCLLSISHLVIDYLRSFILGYLILLQDGDHKNVDIPSMTKN